MTFSTDTFQTGSDEHVTETQYYIKKYAAERLLAWGFDPARIALMLGCSTQWIESVVREQAIWDEHPLT